MGYGIASFALIAFGIVGAMSIGTHPSRTRLPRQGQVRCAPLRNARGCLRGDTATGSRDAYSVRGAPVVESRPR